MPWDQAAAAHFRTNQRAAGNGSLMRATTPAVHFARHGQHATLDAARRIAALTHGDPAAWEGTAAFHELLRLTLHRADPLDALPGVLDLLHPDHRPRYATVLAPDWHPDRATEFNGAVWPCLGSALWALRTTGGYEDALRAAVDLGGDTDTVAAVTGALAGAAYGGGRDPRPLDRTAARPPPRLRRTGPQAAAPPRPRGQPGGVARGHAAPPGCGGPGNRRQLIRRSHQYRGAFPGRSDDRGRSSGRLAVRGARENIRESPWKDSTAPPGKASTAVSPRRRPAGGGGSLHPRGIALSRLIVLDEAADGPVQDLCAGPVVLLFPQGVFGRPEPLPGVSVPVHHLVDERRGDQLQALGQPEPGGGGRRGGHWRPRRPGSAHRSEVEAAGGLPGVQCPGQSPGGMGRNTGHGGARTEVKGWVRGLVSPTALWVASSWRAVAVIPAKVRNSRAR